MSTEFVSTSVQEPVATPGASPDTATPTAPPIAPAVAPPSASIAEGGAAPATPEAQGTDTQTPPESVGIANLRNHLKAVETDLATYKAEATTYKATHDTIQQKGGIATVEPAMELYSGLSTINPAEFDPGSVLGQMWDAHPENFSRTLFFAIDNIPELREYAVAKYGKPATTPAPTQQPQAKPQISPEAEPFYDETDPVQAAWKQRYEALEAKYNGLEARISQSDEQRKQAQQQQTQVIAAQRIETEVDGKLRPILNDALTQLKGWSDDDIGKVFNDIRVELEKNPTYTAHYADAKRAAEIGARGALLKLMPTLQDVVGQQIKKSIEYFSSRFALNTQASEVRRDAATARRDITNTGTVPPPQEKQYSDTRLNNPDFVNDLTADVMAQFARRR